MAEEPSFASLVEGNPRGKDLQLRGTIGYKATVQPRTGGDALEKVAQALRGKGKAAEQEREGKRYVQLARHESRRWRQHDTHTSRV